MTEEDKSKEEDKNVDSENKVADEDRQDNDGSPKVDLPPPPPSSKKRGNGPSDGMPPEYRPRVPRIIPFLVVITMIAVMIYSFRSGGRQSGELENETAFRTLVEKGQVEKCELVIESGGRKKYIKGVRKGTEDEKDGVAKNFTLDVDPDSTGYLREYLRTNNIPVGVKYSNPIWGDIIAQLIPMLIFIGILFFFFSRQARNNMGPFSFGKSRAKKLDTEKTKVTFENVAGVEEAKEEVQEIIEFLKDPKKFARLGGRIPKGVLLMGPPGTGKTLLAKAIAGEAGVPFFSISGSDFVEMFVGVGASRVRDLFEQGKRNAPCIIFVDEIDAVGRSRGTGIGGGHDEREQTLNAMLVEMDGFDTSDGVIVVAATNRPDVLDKALLRPGRFDRQIVIDLPTLEGRRKILGIHAKKVKLAPTANLDRIARGTPGFSGADLANLMNEAALLAARLNHEAVDTSDLEEARDKVCWGRERRGRMVDEEEKRLTAFHEAGHAIVMAMIKGGEPIHKVTIIPRGMALGATMFLPKKDSNHYTRTRMLAQLATSMGGRVAEELFLDDISSGARQDLSEATKLARSMVCDWGMSEKLGPRTFGSREEMMFLGREVGRSQDFSEATSQLIDSEVDVLVRDAYKTAKDILSGNEAKVRVLVDALLEKETVDGDAVEEIVKFGRILTDVERTAADVPSAAPIAEPEASDAAPVSPDSPDVTNIA